jgi:hypothetical protein
MIFFEILYFVCISLSFSVMWSYSEIFNPVRIIISRIPYIRKPLLCPECSSFWVGFFVSFFYNPVILDIEITGLSNIVCALITHLFAFYFYKNIKVEKKINFIK